MTDAVKYSLLSDAQNQIVADLAGIYPKALYQPVGYGSIPQLITTDHQTFTFGIDVNGNPIAPIGKVGIYQTLNDIPGYPWVEGCDYVLLGGTAIQIPNNGQYTGSLYWRGIAPPPDISATSQPVLFPEASRELIVIRAVYNYAQEANRNAALEQTVAQRYGFPLVPTAGQFAQWCLTWKTAFQAGGALRAVSGLAVAVGSETNQGGGSFS